jgi:hypothetical protein
MSHHHFLKSVLAGVGVLCVVVSARAADTPAPAEHAMHHAATEKGAPQTDEELIASAM